MEKKKFETVLALIVPEVVRLIVEKHQIGEVDAAKSFYASKVYETLEDEDTKLWHLSPLTLFHMYDEEKRTGKITFPEEQA